MRTIFSERHRLRDAQTELYGGEFVPPFESPIRADLIRERVEETGLGEILHARMHGLAPILRLHDAQYVAFLENAHEEWRAAGFHGDAVATSWPARRMHGRPPRHIGGRIGYYAFAAETAIDEGTYEAARAAVDVALTAGERIVEGERAVFALCRPPGHHATRDMFGGYCFFNNAAIAAESLRCAGVERLAILDIDFHHGNGTQDLFYERCDILFASLHGDPAHAFPYFLGSAEERGRGAGEGYNHNYPLPPGTTYDGWSEALELALGEIRRFGAEVVVVSLGVDTSQDDPLGFFQLKGDDYPRIGARIASLRRPTLFVMEGGYAIEELADNTLGVLRGFEEN